MRVLDETTSIWGEAFQETDEEDVDVQSETVQTKEVDKMSQLKDLLKEMAAEIPGFISADVAGMDGLSIAHYSTDQNFDAEAAVSQFALVMKLVQKTSGQLKAGEVEDNLVTTKDGYILSRFLGDGSYYMAIAVDRDNSSLGNVRLMTRNFAPELWNAIPRRG
jgi:predicted regulator of Ras-like GTPase activity (Roadblock/LC7/MglB family)